MTTEARGLYFHIIQVDCCYGESMYRLPLRQDHRSVNQMRQMEPSPLMRSQQSVLVRFYDWHSHTTQDCRHNEECDFNQPSRSKRREAEYWSCSPSTLCHKSCLCLAWSFHCHHEREWADTYHYMHHHWEHLHGFNHDYMQYRETLWFIPHVYECDIIQVCWVWLFHLFTSVKWEWKALNCGLMLFVWHFGRTHLCLVRVSWQNQYCSQICTLNWKLRPAACWLSFA